MVTIAVGVQDRPTLAPEGVTEYGFVAVGNPTFILGVYAALIIFVSSSGTSAFVPM